MVDRIVNAMSVDVEDYFQVSAFDGVVARDQWATMESRVEANTHRLLDMFDTFSVRATFFMLGWVVDRVPQLARQIADRGHELASHGFGHKLIYSQTPDEFRQDVRRARQLIEDVTGSRVRGYRAPSFSVTPRSLWAFDVLLAEGYEYDASVFPIHHDRYGLPDAPRHPYRQACASGTITEVPASTVRLAGLNLPVAGGGYFRLLPYAWTRWGIRHLNRREGRPAIFYLHPWEIDPDQPRLAVTGMSRFRHYRNLHLTEPRLQKLMREFRFETVAHVLAQSGVEKQAVA